MKPKPKKTIKEQLAALAAIPDDQIDLSDAPELSDEHWASSERGRFFRNSAPQSSPNDAPVVDRRSEKARTCPNCGQEMHRELRAITFIYKGQSATFDMPGWYCEGCGEGVHTGDDMQVSDSQLQLLKAKAGAQHIHDDAHRVD
ncbi:MAG: YgiT-type zinc finger protein [Capsulimonadaceae bacterium]|nr:YgiT-type zinc finger protein [Capsulimonadaceae bacterium]